MSIRKSIGGANVGNSLATLGKGVKCFRCGATDNLLREFHVPFTRVLAYAPQKNGKKGTKEIRLTTVQEANTDATIETEENTTQPKTARRRR